MATSVNPLTGSSSSSDSANSAASALGGTVPSEQMFLQLLVAQLQNQDPLNPTDSTTFVTQLAQFSELEQVMAIRSDTDTLVTDASTAASSTNTTSGSTTNNTSTGTQATNSTQS